MILIKDFINNIASKDYNIDRSNSKHSPLSYQALHIKKQKHKICKA